MIAAISDTKRSLKGFWFHDGIKTVWNTRCLLHAPGRSAGFADTAHWRNPAARDTFRISGRGLSLTYHATRADAARAAWMQDRTGPAFAGETWEQDTVDGFLAFKEMIDGQGTIPDHMRSFWYDAYRVVR